MPTYYVTHDGEEHRVDLEPADAGSYAMTLDGVPHQVDARPVNGDLLSMLIDGVSYDVDLEHGRAVKGDELATRLNVKVHDAVLEVEVLDERRRNLRDLASSAAAGGGRQEIQAPMPGKVIKYLVKPGDTVSTGQGLVVIEAMKMENEITSPGDGEVQELRVEAGSAVEAGMVLLVVE